MICYEGRVSTVSCKLCISDGLEFLPAHEALIGLKIATAQEDLLEMDEGTKGKRVASVSDQQRLRPSTSNKRR